MIYRNYSHSNVNFIFEILDYVEESVEYIQKILEEHFIIDDIVISYYFVRNHRPVNDHDEFLFEPMNSIKMEKIRESIVTHFY